VLKLLTRAMTLAICCAALLVLGQPAGAGLTDALGRPPDGPASRPTDPGRRVALVIGNGDYAWSPLKNARNDARAVAAALRDLGFDVVDGYDLDLEDTADLLRMFGRRLAGAGLAVFYYAGTGYELDGRNYLVPVGGSIESAADPDRVLGLDAVQATLEAQPRVSLLFVDACRDYPFAARPEGGDARRPRADAQEGLAPMRAGAGTLVSFATQPGQVAEDGAGEHSPYAAALLRHLRTPDLEVHGLMRRVRGDVVAETDGRQTPWDTSSLRQDFYLSPACDLGAGAETGPAGRRLAAVLRQSGAGAGASPAGPERAATTAPDHSATAGTPETLGVAGERRVALVIGNGAYAQVASLPNPGNDARAMAAMLGRVGFDPVTLRTDLGKADLERELRAFARTAAAADVAVVYFAGHGLGIGLGGRAGDVTASNWLVPVDAKLELNTDVLYEAVRLEDVLAATEGARRLRLVLLDACRDNPFVNAMRRRDATRGGAGKGLARIEPAGGTVVVFAARDGTTAVDGLGNQAHSPFTSALLESMPVPGQELDKLIRVVQDKVIRATAGRQEPFQYSSRGPDDFYFVPNVSVSER
jgi:uncharacterized caspase-like protein